MPLPAHIQSRRDCLTFVVLGATGNLARRKLLPALFQLYLTGHLPPRARIVGVGRTELTDEQFHEFVAAAIRQAWETPRAALAGQGGLAGSGGSGGHQRQGSFHTLNRQSSSMDLDGLFHAPPTRADIGGCAETLARTTIYQLDSPRMDKDDVGGAGDPDRAPQSARSSAPGSRRISVGSVSAGEHTYPACPEHCLVDFLTRTRYARMFPPVVSSARRASDSSSSIDDDAAAAADESLRATFDLVEGWEAENPDAPRRNRLYYFAMPSELYPPVANAVHRGGRAVDGGWTRLVLEKPFGSDAVSAAALNRHLAKAWKENSLYRIDRYLGKEVIDNLLVMRFANRLLTPIWNRDNIANVQIIHKEPFGAISDYFDRHGIIRDVLQNHLLQVLAVLAMDRPVSLDPEDIRDAKLKVLRQVDRVDVERRVVAGQYVAHEGKLGYKDNPSVAADSRAPTFAMIVLNIRNERWDGVPFILKAGKALNEKRSEIRIQLRQTPGDIFGDDPSHRPEGSGANTPGDENDPTKQNAYAGPNEFVLRLQPHEEMYMKLTIKEPGLGVQPVPSEMELSGRWRAEQLRKEAAGEAPRRAYERLLLDAVHGHQAHFVRGDELEAAWSIVDPVNAAIARGDVPLHEYPFGTRGPTQADALRAAVGHVAFVVPRDGVHLSSADDLASYDFSPKHASVPAGDVWGRAMDTGPGLMPPTHPA